MSQKLSVPHPRKKIDKTTLIVLCVIGVVLLIGCVVLGAAFDYALGADSSIDGSKISRAFRYVTSHPEAIIQAVTKKDGYVPKMLFVGVCVIGIFALYKYSEEPKRLHRRGTEHGSAKWADEKEVRALAEKEKKPYQLALRDENGGYLYDDKGEFICAQVDYNIVLAKDVYLALNTKQHRLNLNTLAYVYLERQENEVHGSQGVLYPVSYTQDVFDLIVADMVAVTETQYHGQQCPNADCSVHYHEEPNPDYAAAQADLTAAITRRDDWNIMVIPRSNDYVNAVNEYNNTPAAGQPYAQQRVDSTYALFVQAVNNWSSVFGIWGLNIDGQLGASMQARLNREVTVAETARNNTPETIRSPYYTCDHLHTLHSFGLNFYTAEQVMQTLSFTEDEKQWVALTAMNIQQYLVQEGGT